MKANPLADHLLTDLYTYVNDGLMAMGDGKLFEQPHREMCEFVEQGLPPSPDRMQFADQTKSMLLMPRECLKTTVAAQGLAEYFLLKWKYLYNYDGRVAIVRANREAAEMVVQAIAIDISTGNPVLQRAFGNLLEGGDKWTAKAIKLNCRETNYREASVFAAAPGSPITGMHFDLIILDDLANEQNFESPAEMQKAETYVQTILPVLNAWGSLLFIGTRWGHNDPAAFILKMDEALEESGKKPGWRKLIRGAYLDDGSGRLLYPAFLTEQRLEKKREGMTEKLFTSQYLNVVTVESSKVFQEAWLIGQWYDGEYTPDSDEGARLKITDNPKYEGAELPVTSLLVIDPAATAASTSNFTAMAVCFTDADGTLWVHDTWKGKEVPSEIRSRIIGFVGQYNIEELSIDTLGQQILWVDDIQRDLTAAGLKCRVRLHKGKKLTEGKITSGIRTKASRIEALQPLFKYGRIFLRKGRCTPILNEYRFYDGPTHKNHYDMLDALAQAPVFAKKPDTRNYAERLEQLEEEMEFEEAGFTPSRKRHWAGR